MKVTNESNKHAFGACRTPDGNLCSDCNKPWRRLNHKISHLLGGNEGQVWSCIDIEKNIWIGFKCDGCGVINGVHKENL